MTRDEITDRARRLVQDQWGTTQNTPCPAITDSTTFAEGLDFDSLDHVELVMSFEEEFDLEVSDEDAEGLKSFGQAVEYLVRRVEVVAG